MENATFQGAKVLFSIFSKKFRLAPPGLLFFFIIVLRFVASLPILRLRLCDFAQGFKRTHARRFYDFAAEGQTGTDKRVRVR